MTSPSSPLVDRFGEDGVRRFSSAVADLGRPHAAALTRITALLLPLQVGPYFHTVEGEPVSLREYADDIEQPLDAEHASWARLGSDRAYDLVANPDGEVHALLIGYDEPLKFVNSSPEALADALLGLDVLLETIGSTDDPEVASTAFSALEERLRQADPRAFAGPENWWPLVLDDIRDTASVEGYASFEIVDQEGKKEIFTASGAICLHPEERLWSSLDAAGVQPEQVTRIHTELEACSMPGHYCSMWLAMMFPDATLTHNFPYGESAASRREGIRQLLAAQRGGGM
ncbi:nucleic acid/nucleotide deaminase domain-containing protein [Kitasatospora sp. NPDC093679]|uniref:nucleic acid/nucleotide deaminase domain-containing protein n=1 Tax=Kitasatospora sp. NPDC093679 TaxID=3154983 RepID=UPI0034258682